MYDDTESLYQFAEDTFTIPGESNVYTLGNIGVHRVVCTKLPTVGHTREAMIAAGNTTTRLLGKKEFEIFQYCPSNRLCFLIRSASLQRVC